MFRIFFHVNNTLIMCFVQLLDDQKKLDEEEAIRNKMRRMRKLQEDEENRKVQLQLKLDSLLL